MRRVLAASLAFAAAGACLPDSDPGLTTDAGTEFAGDAARDGFDARDASDSFATCEAGSDGTTAPPVVCSGDGWCWEHPLPRGGTHHDLWTFSPCDAWVAGDGRSLLHWDGAVWSPIDVDGILSGFAGSNFTLTDLFGLPPAVLWVVVRGWDPATSRAVGILLRRDDTGWTTRGDWSGWNADINEMWADDDGDIWVTRLSDDPLHWDGDTWQSPEAPSGFASFLWGSGPDDVWALGDRALRWNGASWAEVPIGPGGGPVTGRAIGGVARDDVWLFEDDGIDHYDGRSWTQYPWPVPVSLGRNLWGGEPDDVWAASDAGVLHWDGRAWAVSAGTSGENLYAVHGSSADDVWAAGAAGRLLHWDGSAWSRSTRLTTADLTAIDGTSSDDVWAVGKEATVLHRDAGGWTRIDIGTDRWLYGVRALSADDVWVVGDQGLAVHWDGSAWTITPTPTTEMLTGVWGARSDSVWAVGWQDGSILRWDGARWTSSPVEPSSPPPRFDSVWSSTDTDGWAVGGGAIFHWNGTRWTWLDVGVTGYWDVVMGTAPDDVWFAGASGSPTLHWDGTTWQSYHTGINDTQVGMWVVGPGDVWLVDSSGGIHRGGEGPAWTELRSGTTTWLTDVWAPGPDEAWAVGWGGTILHWTR